MQAWMDPLVLEDLRRAYERGNMVVFAGAGVSAAAGLPAWPALAAQLLQRLRALHLEDPRAAEMSDLLRKEKILPAMTVARAALGDLTFGDLVTAALDDTGKDVPAPARAIADLRPRLRAVVTTNLDRILERAFGGSWDVHVEPEGDLAAASSFIWKAHGTLRRRGTWVFTRTDYDRTMFGAPLHRTVFSAIYHACTFLFVGCSLGDDDLDMTLGQVRALAGSQPPKHFAVLEGPVSSYRRRTLEDAGIRIIEYPQSRHEHIVEVLEALGGRAAEAPPGRTDAGTSWSEVPLPAAANERGTTAEASAMHALEEPPEVFIIAASPENLTLRDTLSQQLGAAQRRGILSCWHPGQMRAGTPVAAMIGQHLERARIFVVLMTAELFARDNEAPSKFPTPLHNEMNQVRRALARASEGSAEVLPVIAKASLWQLTELAGLQVLPADHRPVMGSSGKADAWTAVAMAIVDRAQQLSTKPRVAPPPAAAPSDLGGFAVLLEKTVRERAPFIDVRSLLAFLERIKSCVCRIEDRYDKPLGTGFLIGPGLVLTSHHVIEDHLSRPGRNHGLHVRFDYVADERGLSVPQGRVYPLAPDLCAAYSPSSEVDLVIAGRSPREDELDFALLRVEGRPEAEEMNDGPRRWVKLADSAVPEPSDIVLVFQHPRGHPLKITIDQVLHVNENRTRIRYAANAEPGSSGSPCFDLHQRLLALHQGALTTSNQGIAAVALLEHLRGRGLDGLLGQ